MKKSELQRGIDALEVQVVIVTGGSRGLGKAIADGFVSQKCRVAIVGRNHDALESAAKDMEGKVLICCADMAKEAEVDAMVSRVTAQWGKIDILVNNAGINPFYQKAENTSSAEWQQIIDVNLTGVFVASKHVGKEMLKQGKGVIINITSIAVKVALDRTTAYCAAKAGVERMTAELGLEWAQRGVRVNSVGPGYFRTDLTKGLRGNEALSETIRKKIPTGRFGNPKEVVGACLFLASDAAAYITGTTLMVDGGWTV